MRVGGGRSCECKAELVGLSLATVRRRPLLAMGDTIAKRWLESKRRVVCRLPLAVSRARCTTFRYRTGPGHVHHGMGPYHVSGLTGQVRIQSGTVCLQKLRYRSVPGKQCTSICIGSASAEAVTEWSLQCTVPARMVPGTGRMRLHRLRYRFGPGQMHSGTAGVSSGACAGKGRMHSSRGCI